MWADQVRGPCGEAVRPGSGEGEGEGEGGPKEAPRFHGPLPSGGRSSPFLPIPPRASRTRPASPLLRVPPPRRGGRRAERGETGPCPAPSRSAAGLGWVNVLFRFCTPKMKVFCYLTCQSCRVARRGQPL